MPQDRHLLEEYFKDAPKGLSLEQLKLDALPQHVALIMDGNGRWAQKRGLSRSLGHIEGVKTLQELVTSAVRLGIPYISVYAFSTENWKRPQEEVNMLMALFAEEIHNQMPLLQKESVRLHFIGDIESLPQETRDSFYEGLELTKDNDKLCLSLAVNYGARAELLRAAQLIGQDLLSSKLSLDEITEEVFADKLYTNTLPDPDLLIRSSGELRLSNYLLWQLAYTELYSTKVLWPDFTRFDFLEALLSYQERSRRYGGV